MKLYEYSEQERKLIEESTVPIAVYQYVNKRVITIAVSDGFREYLGLSSLEETYEIMNNDLFHFTHPDDVVEMTDAAVRFAVYDEPYDIVYRSKRGDGYVIAHAKGKHIWKETGERLAVVAYTVEGVFNSENSEIVMGFNLLKKKYFQNKKLDGKLNYDYLTGLPALDYFFELAETYNRAEEERDMSMLFLDFDGMQGYNQRYGYYQGDSLIKEMANLLAHTFSAENCCRTTADHFTVYTITEGLQDKLQKLIEDVKNLRNGNSLHVKIGVYDCKIQAVSVATATDRAKIACDSCGKIFESQIAYFSMKMLKKLEERRYIYENFDKAISEGWIKVYYQPIVRTSSDRVCNEEALVRWMDPEKGVLLPEYFIPFLEEAKISYKLDLYVLEQVIEKQKKQSELGIYVVPDSINLSRTDFYACEIVDEICKRVDDSGLPRTNFVFEITESAVVDDIEYIYIQVDRLRKAGFGVWLDDFGSGYSAPDTLKRIHFDVVKLDKSFFDQINENAESRIIITELVRLASGLGSETVAEGIETEEQVEFIKEIGCTRIQGFHYCEAISFEEIIERRDTGKAIGFENPKASDYYGLLGNVNLYDLSFNGEGEYEKIRDYFNTMPMFIIEISDKGMKVARGNQSFKTYNTKHRPDIMIDHLFTHEEIAPLFDPHLISVVHECAENGKPIVTDVKSGDSNIVHIFVRKIATNPEDGTVALSIVILGFVDNVAEIKHKEELERIQQERKTFERMTVLSGKFICVYTVSPKTDEYVQFVIDERYNDAGMPAYGKSFYNEVVKKVSSVVFKDDLELFNREFNGDKIHEAIYKKGIFSLNLRMLFKGEIIYVNIKAAKIEEDNGPQILVGMIDMNEQVKREQEYIRELMTVKDMVNVDALTGVKNKHAYAEVEKQIDTLIADNKAPEFAVVVCDINDLKEVNDKCGHQAGDQYIKDGCSMICTQFPHSPVFRFGGDEFVVIVEGNDYARLDEIMEEIAGINNTNKKLGKIVVAVGMCRYKGVGKMKQLFEIADACMYENKKELKDTLEAVNGNH